MKQTVEITGFRKVDIEWLESLIKTLIFNDYSVVYDTVKDMLTAEKELDNA